MSITQLLGLSLAPVRKAVALFIVRRQLAQEKFNERFFADRIRHDTEALRDVHYRQVALHSQLNALERGR